LSGEKKGCVNIDACHQNDNFSKEMDVFSWHKPTNRLWKIWMGGIVFSNKIKLGISYLVWFWFGGLVFW
jgi:hypothetical protein